MSPLPTGEKVAAGQNSAVCVLRPIAFKPPQVSFSSCDAWTPHRVGVKDVWSPGWRRSYATARSHGRTDHCQSCMRLLLWIARFHQFPLAPSEQAGRVTDTTRMSVLTDSAVRLTRDPVLRPHLAMGLPLSSVQPRRTDTRWIVRRDAASVKRNAGCRNGEAREMKSPILPSRPPGVCGRAAVRGRSRPSPAQVADSWAHGRCGELNPMSAPGWVSMWHPACPAWQAPVSGVAVSR